MNAQFRITLAQLNPSVGDIKGNAELARAAWAQARAEGADLLALPEMFLIGYNAQDLVLKPAFVADAMDAAAALARDCADGPAIAIGMPWAEGGSLYNAYVFMDGGQIIGASYKYHLPNTHVFDEKRLFDQPPMGGPVALRGLRIGSPICEDIWNADVAETMAETGAELLLVPNGSPYDREKRHARLNHTVARVVETDLPLIYLNLVGGQDDQIFDGGSFALNPGGKLALQMPYFMDATTTITLAQTDDGWRVEQADMAPAPDEAEADYHAMVLGLRDYCAKTGFARVLLGLSGGIDSALVAAIAVDALGADAVRGVMLPSPYTSDHSLEDARALAAALGCHLDNLPIEPARSAIEGSLAPFFAGTTPDLTEENIQSRLRGLFLMALSNKTGAMLLTTGNKSEVAVGYATIYGDMAGGYNPIKDLYKTRVFAISCWRNAQHRDWMAGPAGAVIPERIITKPPSAELRPDQKDSDSLPEYDVLDGILEMLVDRDASVADCVAAGFNRDDVKRIEHLLYISEYKRFQSAPGARLSNRAFWLDRRYPIANRWRDPS